MYSKYIALQFDSHLIVILCGHIKDTACALFDVLYRKKASQKTGRSHLASACMAQYKQGLHFKGFINLLHFFWHCMASDTSLSALLLLVVVKYTR